MGVCIVTGSAGLIGSEAARWFVNHGLEVVGIDNDMRKVFFGVEASTRVNLRRLRHELTKGYRHHSLDIRNRTGVQKVFERYGHAVALVIHCAAQPSHDWAARDPYTDFGINANGTLNLLECTRQSCPEAVFILMSTNKVYGDAPNRLPFVEQETRWDLSPEHPYSQKGVPESLSIDQCLHSLFGASKLAADILTQEYGRYYGMRTAIFRGGCLTGPMHAGTELHGFLAYLVRCALSGREYVVHGYSGKQVRDNIHSRDVVACMQQFWQAPRIAEVYNIGGGYDSNCSIREAVALCENIMGRPMKIRYSEPPRTGDHIWYISDMSKFRAHYPAWRQEYDVERIIAELLTTYAHNPESLRAPFHE